LLLACERWEVEKLEKKKEREKMEIREEVLQ
jgi:hypothetical protein